MTSRVLSFSNKTICINVIFILVLAMNLYATPRGRVTIANGTVVTDRGTQLRGLPLWLNPYIDETDKGTLNFISVPEYRDYFRNISQRYGLNAIRICYTAYYAFNGDRYTKEQITPQTYKPAMDSIVQWAGEDGIYVIINYHDVGHYDLDHMKAFWEYAAATYKDETHVVFELMNEPVKWYAKNYDTDDIAMVKTLYDLVRAAAPQTHLILWSFANLGSAGEATEKVSVDGISYDNASVGFHFGYGGGNDESILDLKTNNIPSLCTEFKSKDEATASTDYERLIKYVKVFEQTGVSWFTWAPTAANVNPDLKITDQFMTEMDEAEICWEPDYGTWPHNCSSDTSDTSINNSPVVEIKEIDSVNLGEPLFLEAIVTDDGLPANSQMSYQWKKELGPGTVSFTTPDQISTHATFSHEGEYTVTCEADDGEKSNSDVISIVVLATTTVKKPSSYIVSEPQKRSLINNRYDCKGRLLDTKSSQVDLSPSIRIDKDGKHLKHNENQ